MTTDQLKTVILEAVDCLRQRKCRPDRESIAVYVMRKLGSSMNEIFSEIENTVDQGLLLKVEYKGSTSYRSPKNFDLKNSPLLTKHSKILNSSKTTRYVISGMNELLSAIPAYSQMGVPYEELKKKLMEFDKERFAEAAIKVIFEREEGAGSIQVAQADDPLDPIRIFPKDIKVPEDMKLITFAEDTSEPPERKKKKRSKKEGKEGDVSSTSTSSGSPPVKKEKQVLVYAVKSDPHKLVDTSLRDEESVKAKVEQISSIGLKVISEKGAIRKTPNKPKAKNGVHSQKQTVAATKKKDDANSEKGLDRKPSLALVKLEPPENTVVNGTPEIEPKNIKVESNPALSSKPKVVKRKSEASSVQKTSKPVKQKKLKLDPSSNVTEEPAVVSSRNPPKYTYSSKKRTKEPEFGETDDSMERVFKKISKGDAEKLVAADSSNGHLSECAYCKQEKNATGDPEDFLSCGTCNAKIHPSCIAYSEDHAKRLRMNTDSKDSHLQWQCFSCKRCGVCQKALMNLKNGSEMKKTKAKISKKNEQRYILCDHCDRGYHVKCISGNPPQNETSWYCVDCSNEAVNSTNENQATKNVSPKKSKALVKKSVKVTPTKKKGVQSKSQSDASKPKAKSQNGNQPSANEISTDSNASVSTSDEEVPDISGWTPAQVQKYFTEKGLQDEAASLREQEIDGMSLLLLRRADVIFGLNLRLGPALKIYRLVCQLQQHASALKKKEVPQKST